MKRYVSTGLPASDKKAKEILDSVIGQLSDGIWENSSGMRKYWQNLDITTKDGEIVIAAEDSYRSPFSKYVESERDKKIADFFANKIKQIIKVEKEDDYTTDAKNIEWKRDCEAVSEYMGYDEKITVKDCYRVYDKLKGRKDRVAESRELKETTQSEEDRVKISKVFDELLRTHKKLDLVQDLISYSPTEEADKMTEELTTLKDQIKKVVMLYMENSERY